MSEYELIDLFEKGGPLMWLILAASVVGIAVTLERLYTLQRSKILPPAFVDRIRGMVAKGKVAEARLLCEENNSSIARLIVAALRVHERSSSRPEIKEAVDEVGAREIALLDRNIEIVGTCASISPLLGLLGTVVGMIQVFSRFADAWEQGQGTPDVFAEGIYTALITTAYGLMVAIPLLVIYKFLMGRNDRLIVAMEENVMGIVDLLEEANLARAARQGAGESRGQS